MKTKIIKEYDEDGNEIYLSKGDGYERWTGRSEDGTKIYHWDSNGVVHFAEYYRNNKEAYHYSNKGLGVEYWYEYDENGSFISFMASDGDSDYRSFYYLRKIKKAIVMFWRSL